MAWLMVSLMTNIMLIIISYFYADSINNDVYLLHFMKSNWAIHSEAWLTHTHWHTAASFISCFWNDAATNTCSVLANKHKKHTDLSWEAHRHTQSHGKLTRFNDIPKYWHTICDVIWLIYDEDYKIRNVVGKIY